MLRSPELLIQKKSADNSLASLESEMLHGLKIAETCKNQRQRHPIQLAKMVAFPFS